MNHSISGTNCTVSSADKTSVTSNVSMTSSANDKDNGSVHTQAPDSIGLIAAVAAIIIVLLGIIIALVVIMLLVKKGVVVM